MTARPRRRQTRSRARFLDDQRAGAAADLEGYLNRALGSTPGTERADMSNPVVAALAERLLELIRNGQVRPCSHVDPGAPAPTFWVAAMPEEICCRLCMVSAGGVLYQRHGRGQLPCDVCGATGRPVDSVRVRVAATLILATACPRCMSATSAVAVR